MVRKSGFGDEGRGPRMGAPRLRVAEKFMHAATLGARAAARVCCRGVLASVLSLAATLEGGVATLSASLPF